jgi:hypothetical protein
MSVRVLAAMRVLYADTPPAARIKIYNQWLRKPQADK